MSAFPGVEWADQTILAIGTHFAAPQPVTSFATARRSGLRCEGALLLDELDAAVLGSTCFRNKLARDVLPVEQDIPVLVRYGRGACDATA
jgi:hypothetical protein